MSEFALWFIYALAAIGVTALLWKSTASMARWINRIGALARPSFKACVASVPFFALWFGLMAGFFQFFGYLYRPEDRKLFEALTEFFAPLFVVGALTAATLYLSLGALYAIYRTAPQNLIWVSGIVTAMICLRLLHIVF